MRILLLSLYYEPDIAANAVIVTQLAEELALLGHDVTVVTSFPHYSTNRIRRPYRGKLLEWDEHNGVRIARCYIYVPEEKGNIAGRVLNYVSFSLLSATVGSVGGRHDVVLAPSPPLTIGLSAYAISRLRRVPFVYNVQDIYPDVAVRLGVLTNPTIISAFEKLERFVYRKAAAVSVISDGFRRNLLAKGVASEKVHVIPNFVDPTFVKPLLRRNGFSKKYDLDDKFVVLFAGNVGLSQGLEHVLQAAEYLADVRDILFLIVGNGAAKESLMAQSEARHLDNVRFLPFQPQADVPDLYASSDVCLVPLRKGMTHESVPSKVYTIMAAGKPLVASVDRDSDTWRFVEEVGCGICVEPECPRQMAEAVLQLYDDCDRSTKMGYRGRECVEAGFTPRAAALQYEALLEQVVNDS